MSFFYKYLIFTPFFTVFDIMMLLRLCKAGVDTSMKKAVLKNSVFLKTFITLSVITFLPLICISLFFSNMAERFWRSENYISSQQSILQYANDVDLKMNVIDSAQMQMFCHLFWIHLLIISAVIPRS